MGYPKNLLSEGEQVIVHRHPHFKMLVFPIIIGLVIIGGGAWLAWWLWDPDTTWRTIAVIALGVVGLALLAWLVLAPFVRWRTTHFVVTTERVKAREGVIKRTGIDIPMARINSVRFEHSLLDRIFGCGTLVIESAAEEPLQFDDIPGVEKVHSWIYRQLNDNPYDDYGAQGRGQPTQQYGPPQQGPAPGQGYPQGPQGGPPPQGR